MEWKVTHEDHIVPFMSKYFRNMFRICSEYQSERKDPCEIFCSKFPFLKDDCNKFDFPRFFTMYTKWWCFEKLYFWKVVFLWLLSNLLIRSYFKKVFKFYTDAARRSRRQTRAQKSSFKPDAKPYRHSPIRESMEPFIRIRIKLIRYGKRKR